MSIKVKESLSQARENESRSKKQFQYIMASLFLCILSFFVMINFYSEQNSAKSRILSKNIRQEFRDKTPEEKIDFAKLGKKYFDGIQEIKYTHYNSLASFLQKHKDYIRYEFSTYDKNYLVYVNESSLFNYNEITFRTGGDKFINSFADFLYKMNNNYMVKVKIVHAKKKHNILKRKSLGIRRIEIVNDIFNKKFEGELDVNMSIFDSNKRKDLGKIIFLINISDF